MRSATRAAGPIGRVAVALLATAWTIAQAWAAEPVQRLEIDTATGPHIYSVEVMHTEAERARGLMDRRTMPKDHGMLFDFHKEQPVYFWMKDTYIPLDMIFVGKTGRVVAIKHDARPMDESLIPSNAPTLGVIELNAGVAKEIGLAIGDRVKNPLFRQAETSR